MTSPDPTLDAHILQRLIDWHDAPANAPRRLDLVWQDAVVFFGLPSDTPEIESTSWNRLYDALEPMVADERVLGELYVNRLRDLRPGYRGLRARDGDMAARLEADREALKDDREALDAARAALEADRARIDRMDARLSAETEQAKRDTELLAVRAEAMTASEHRIAEAEAALADREAVLERDRATALRHAATAQARADADIRSAQRVRMTGVGLVVLAVLGGVYLAATQGWI